MSETITAPSISEMMLDLVQTVRKGKVGLLFISHEYSDYATGNDKKEWVCSAIIGHDCVVAKGRDYEAAKAQLVEKLKAYVYPCDICGGRMDGVFKHTH